MPRLHWPHPLLSDWEAPFERKLLPRIDVIDREHVNGPATVQIFSLLPGSGNEINRSFVRDRVTDPSAMALSQAIIVMVHRLGLKVVAGGVKTEGQCKLLTGVRLWARVSVFKIDTG